MTELLPSLQAEQIRTGLLDYLTTTFALADVEPRQVLGEFLEDPVDGIFKGPYVRLRLPFRPADDGWQGLLDWTPPFPPYRHQAQAYARLTTKGLGPDKPRPLPTIVTTGTGSGKTEAFLHPIIDHCLRARRAGVSGIKALILYPMNALADDQALRLTRLLTEDPALATLTAGLYTGDARDGQPGEGRTKVTPDGLITNRRVLQDSPPDILLTNYKMLDQLLLRPGDRTIWEKSAHSLTYLVLDEFHTYDGAQGTDVAMLLRRLGLAVKHYRPDAGERPLGAITPVATSATLGDGGDPAEMLAFAEQVFGEKLDRGAAITETRLDIDDFTAQDRAATADAQPVPFASMLSTTVRDLAAAGSAHRDDGAALTDAVAAELYAGDVDGLDSGTLLRGHPDVQELIATTGRAQHIDDLVGRFFPSVVTAEDRGTARAALAAVLAALSHLRAGDRNQASVEITMWVREVTRVDRLVSSEPGFLWSDDGALTLTDDGVLVPALPALYCRACGRSGWGVLLAPTGRTLADKDDSIRREHAARHNRFRALLHAPGEAAATSSDQGVDSGLRWLHMGQRALLTHRPADDDEDLRNGLVLPVLMIDGDTEDAEKRQKADECPSCGKADSIRFLGSSIATLLSVSLTTLFGEATLDAREKRALVFTDSVQDAAHRAGFVDHRSHAMSLRAAMRAALSGPTSLDTWAEEIMRRATGDGFARYRLVPPALTHDDLFAPYWLHEQYRAIPAKTLTAVRRRLAFDLALEIGLQTTYGRTLEATGTIGVHVAARSEALREAARRAVCGDDQQPLPGLAAVDPGDLERWARGVLEHLRRDGAITHEWLTKKYVPSEGARIWIWGKRRRDQGAPAFPSGRSAPAFALVGGSPGTHSTFSPVTAAKGWYARWAAKSLGVTAGHGAVLAARLLAELARVGVLVEMPTENSGRVYGIAPENVVVTPLHDDDLTERTTLLVCDICRTPLPVSPAVSDQLDGSRCPMAACRGIMGPAPRNPESFYRRVFETSDMRRVDAHEHTSLLEGSERRDIEAGFKRKDQRPGDPNVLVATPTLEMGIDIGDLTTVMLSSLPDSVAKYTQRVGRGGRLTGSSLALAYVTGRGEQLPRLGEPQSLINGSVRPPATYLDAEEILRRQFVASVVDRMVRDGYSDVPRLAGQALASAQPGSFLGDLVDLVQRRGQELLDTFTSSFPEVDTPGQEALRQWVLGQADASFAEEKTDPSVPEDVRTHDTLEATVYRAVGDFTREVESLRRQQAEIEAALPDLIERAGHPGATADDLAAERTAQGGIRVLRKVISDLTQDPWITGLEERGLLPNYSLLDDTVELQAQVSFVNPESQQYESDPVVIGRGSARALTELAPGAHFYARGLDMTVQGVDLGRDGADIAHHALCDSCGHVHVLAGPTAPSPTVCPRCGSAGIADTGQRLEVLRLNRVFSDVRRDDATIDDSYDTRQSKRFEVLTAVDFDRDRLADEWSVPAVGLGVSHYRRLAMRWYNLGDAGATARRQLAGQEWVSAGFRVCEACGKLDRNAGVSSRDEHRAWCKHRNDTKEHARVIALSRELVTQAVALSLPPAVTMDLVGPASIEAALLLGLRETMGGSPDHLRVTSVPHPEATGDSGATTPAVLLHDTVPGGTGYLTDLATPARLWGVLVRAAHVLEDCPCQAEGRAACYRCLLPFTRSTDSVSRVEALRALRTLLEVDDGTPLADLEPDICTWTVAHEAMAPGGGESPLEMKFRAALKERLGATYSVVEKPGPTGLELRIAGPDGRQWSLTPQVLLEGCKPDFVLTPQDGVLRVAIFTDGYAYHASTHTNRLEDDARKRQLLRDRGYLVLGVTDADLGEPQAPSWLQDMMLTLLMGQPPGQPGAGISRAVVAEQKGGPLAIIEGLIRDPEDKARPQLADAAGLLTGAGQQPYRVSEDDDADALALALLDGIEPSSVGDCMLVAYRRPHLVFATLFNGSSPRRYSLLLDDSADAVADPEFKQSWREWLRLSNLLAHTRVPYRIRTRTEARLSPTETAVATHLWEGVDATALDPDVVDLAGLLTAAGLPAPAVGEELETGSPAEMVWREPRVVVVYPDMDDDEVREIRAAGWTVFRPNLDADTIAPLVRDAVAGKD